MDTVQALRRRAQAAGHLASTSEYSVYPQGEAIVVEPRSEVVYVRYYDPYVVYGPWWWPHYRPVFWRPWAPRPVFVTHGFFYTKPDWHGRHVHVVHKPVYVHRQQVVTPGRWQPRKQVVVRPYVRVPEAQRKPIVQQQMPAAGGFSAQKRDFMREPRVQQQQQRSREPRVQQQQRSREVRGDRGGRGDGARGNSGRGGGNGNGHRR